MVIVNYIYRRQSRDQITQITYFIVLYLVALMDLLASVLIFCIVASSFSIGESQTTFDVIEFGAVGDGETDDSAAFLKAWKALCEAEDTPTLQIPEGKTFLLQSVRFQGPCKSDSVQILILGNIVAPESLQEWRDCSADCWLCFYDVAGFAMNGSGTIDGRGYNWWKGDKNCTRPRAMYFHGCSNFDLSGFTVLNSAKMHISINHCNGGYISNVHINSPADSPNTDGIDISYSTRIHIHDSFIESGDDCIAVNGGCYNINITGIACGPGHGISVGSLGDGGREDKVEEVHVQNCNFTRTQNGVRIKTFEGGVGYARNISFEEIRLIETKNPIIIDQHYSCGQGNSVNVSDVSFTSVLGTSADELAITLDCCNSPGCFNIVMNQVNITSSNPEKKTRAFCRNAHGTSTSTAPDVPCLDKNNGNYLNI